MLSPSFNPASQIAQLFENLVQSLSRCGVFILAGTLLCKFGGGWAYHSCHPSPHFKETMKNLVKKAKQTLQPFLPSPTWLGWRVDTKAQVTRVESIQRADFCWLLGSQNGCSLLSGVESNLIDPWVRSEFTVLPFRPPQGLLLILLRDHF